MTTRASSYLLAAAIAAIVVLPLVGSWSAAAGAGPPQPRPGRPERPDSLVQPLTVHGPPPPPRAERPEGPPPRPVVLTFRHIPAESFLETLKQLGRNPHVGEVLQQIPLALNEPANAVVVLAPPEVAELLMGIAKGLDQPNEFRMAMQEEERRKAEFQVKIEAAKRQMGQPAARPPFAPPQPPMGPGARPPGPAGQPLMGLGARRPVLPPQAGMQGRGPMGPGPRAGPGPMGPGPMAGRGLGGCMCPQCPMMPGRPPTEAPLPQRRDVERAPGPRPEARPPERRDEERAPGRRAEERAPGPRPEARPPERRDEERAPGPRPEARPPERRDEERAPGRRAEERAPGPRPESRPPERRDEERAPGRRAEERAPGPRPEARPPERRDEERAPGRRAEERAPGPRPEARPTERRDEERAPGRRAEERAPGPRPEARPPERRDEPRPPEARGRPEEAPPVPGPMLRNLWSLLSDEARKRLDISDDQAARIRQVLTDAARMMGGVMERLQEQMRDVPPEKRPGEVREWLQKNAPDRMRQLEEIHERILQMLTPPQRERAQQWLRENRPEPPQEPPRQPRPGVREGGSPGGPPAAVLAAQQSLARFLLVEGAEAPPPAPGPGAGGAGGVPPQWAGLAESMFSPEDRARLGEMFRQAQNLRFLEDPDVRSELRFTPEQEKRIQDLRQRAMDFFGVVREDVESKLRGRMPGPDTTEEERQAFRQEAMQVVADAVRAAMKETEGLLGEAGALLTDEQRAMLKAIGTERTEADLLSGGLTYLTTPPAREQFQFTFDQVERIKSIIRDLVADARRLRDETFGPGKEPTQEELRSEKYAPVREKHQEMIKKALERILTVLMSEQREKVQRWFDSRGRGRGGPQGMRRPAGGGPPREGAGGMSPGEPRPAPPPPGAASGRQSGPPLRPAAQEVAAAFFLVMQDAPADEPTPAKFDKFAPRRDEVAERFRNFDFGQLGGLFRTLADAEVREKLRLTSEQERKIAELEERAKVLHQRVRDDLVVKYGPPGGDANLPPADREARRREVMDSLDEAMRLAKADVQDIVREGAAVLTEEQKTQLKEIGRQRQQSDMATGGLALLTTPQAREEFRFSFDQAEKIKTIVRDLEADARRLLDETFGPGKQPRLEELRGQEFAPLREKHKEMVQKALDRIMTILTGEQRDRVRKWADTRMNRGPGGPGGMKKPGPPPAESGKKGYGGDT